MLRLMKELCNPSVLFILEAGLVPSEPAFFVAKRSGGKERKVEKPSNPPDHFKSCSLNVIQRQNLKGFKEGETNFPLFNSV